MKKLGLRLIALAELCLLRSARVTEFKGISIADLRNTKDRNPLFPQAIVAALELIERVDPRRFRRIQRHLKWIVNSTDALDGTANYSKRQRVCFYDFEYFESRWPYEDILTHTAMVLVHESTHGALDSKGVPYSTRLRIRIERLCCREEQRFLDSLASVDPVQAERFRSEFDPKRWEPHWSLTPLQRFKLKIAQLRRRDRERRTVAPVSTPPSEPVEPDL